MADYTQGERGPTFTLNPVWSAIVKDETWPVRDHFMLTQILYCLQSSGFQRNLTGQLESVHHQVCWRIIAALQHTRLKLDLTWLFLPSISNKVDVDFERLYHGKENMSTCERGEMSRRGARYSKPSWPRTRDLFQLEFLSTQNFGNSTWKYRDFFLLSSLSN